MDILALAREKGPENRWALSESGAVLGMYHNEAMGFLPAYALALDGRWYPCQPMRVNGEPMVKKWIE
jgi:hypothetical protein